MVIPSDQGSIDDSPSAFLKVKRRSLGTGYTFFFEAKRQLMTETFFNLGARVVFFAIVKSREFQVP
jgi:hypothetical protein